MEIILKYAIIVLLSLFWICLMFTPEMKTFLKSIFKKKPK